MDLVDLGISMKEMNTLISVLLKGHQDENAIADDCRLLMVECHLGYGRPK